MTAPAPPARQRPRVMLGNLEPIARVGMSRLLLEDGIEIIGDGTQPAGLVLDAARLRPDTVVLALDQTASRELSDRVREASPHTKVVLWARTENVMEVIDPGATRPRWVVSGIPEELLAELSTLQITRAEE